MSSPLPKVDWPDQSRFAFTVFDDPDSQSLEAGKEVYALLDDLGFRTTKGIWVIEPRERNSPGETCESPGFLDWALNLKAKGFEIGFHNGAPGSLDRKDVIRSLDLFRRYFGNDPITMANHYNEDAIYWGPARLSGLRRLIYERLTARRDPRFFGHVPKHASFWGDVCAERIRYCRNFVFPEINTLRACPLMPYHDPTRPFVQRWYASSEGANCNAFIRQISEERQDQLEEEGGACIMYTHFGHQFFENGRLSSEFKRLMTRLASKKGWFVPVHVLLDFLAARQTSSQLSPQQRAGLEWRWLAAKLRYGSS